MHLCRRQKKIGRANDQEGGEQAEKARPINQNEQQDLFQFVSV